NSPVSVATSVLFEPIASRGPPPNRPISDQHDAVGSANPERPQFPPPSGGSTPPFATDALPMSIRGVSSAVILTVWPAFTNTLVWVNEASPLTLTVTVAAPAV